MLSWTALSQTTGISGLSREQKQEVVSTLQEYPLVMKELEITRELLATSNLRNEELYTIVTNQAEQISSLTLRNEITEKQLAIARKQTKAETTSTKDKLLFGAGGVTVGVLLVAIISIF